MAIDKNGILPCHPEHTAQLTPATMRRVTCNICKGTFFNILRLYSIYRFGG